MGRNRCSDERQAQIYEVIKSFLMEKGYPPSVREIGKIVGLKSSSTVHGYLAKLPRYRPNGSNTSNLYTLK